MAIIIIVAYSCWQPLCFYDWMTQSILCKFLYQMALPKTMSCDRWVVLNHYLGHCVSVTYTRGISLLWQLFLYFYRRLCFYALFFLYIWHIWALHSIKCFILFIVPCCIQYLTVNMPSFCVFGPDPQHFTVAVGFYNKIPHWVWPIK